MIALLIYLGLDVVFLLISLAMVVVLLGMDLLLLPDPVRRYFDFPTRRERREWTPWD